jgi:hypothetical protein
MTARTPHRIDNTHAQGVALTRRASFGVLLGASMGFSLSRSASRGKLLPPRMGVVIGEGSHATGLSDDVSTPTGNYGEGAYGMGSYGQ